MDLSVIKEALGNLKTFLDAIPNLFKGIPELFNLLGSWFSDTKSVAGTGGPIAGNEKLGIVDAWEHTAGIFKAAEETPAPAPSGTPAS